jgi:hypothetical protein
MFDFCYANALLLLNLYYICDKRNTQKYINIAFIISFLMKNTLLEAVKTLVADKGLKAEQVKNLAELFTTIKGLTDDSSDEDVTNALASGGDIIKAIASQIQTAASEADRVAAQRVTKKFEGWIDPKTIQQQQQANPPEPPANNNGNGSNQQQQQAITAQDIQKLIDTAVAAAVQPFQQERETQRLRKLLDSNDRVKDMPQTFRNRYQLDKEENLDTTITQMEQDYAAMKQELIKAGVFAEPPATGNGATETDDVVAALQRMGAKATTK